MDALVTNNLPFDPVFVLNISRKVSAFPVISDHLSPEQLIRMCPMTSRRVLNEGQCTGTSDLDKNWGLPRLEFLFLRCYFSPPYLRLENAFFGNQTLSNDALEKVISVLEPDQESDLCARACPGE